MRLSMFAVIPLVSFSACTSKETPTHERPAAATPDKSPAPAIPKTSNWALDPENSSVEFVCKHVFTNVRGMFAKPAGAVTLDDATPGNSKISATIDVGTISTGVEERDTHLKSPDFFNLARYPVATFVSTNFTKSNDTSYEVTGTLTMHGVAKPVTLAVTASAPFNHAGGIRRGIEATTTINRRDFGLVWDFPGEGSGVVVGDNIKITIGAELVLLPEPTQGG